MQLCADSLPTTRAIAAALSGLARPGDVIALAGEMGAGKTAFAQGFGAALGIEEAITSPTFTLVHSYPIPGTKWVLHHADLYRLDTTYDVDDLALHELAEFGGIVLVEWGDVAAAAIGDHLEVRLEVRLDVGLDVGLGVDEPATGGDDDLTHDDLTHDDLTHDDLTDDEFGLDGSRLITIEASGLTWAGRWGRLTAALEPFRC